MQTLTLDNAMKLLARMNDTKIKDWHWVSIDYDAGIYRTIDMRKLCKGKIAVLTTANTPQAAIRAAADRLGVEYQDLLTKESG